MEKNWRKRRKRLLEILEVGNDLDYVSRAYDFINASSIVLNLVASIMYTFADLREQYGTVLVVIEEVTIAFFGIDYILRVWTARFLYPNETEPRAIGKYVFSFTGLVDLFSFLPHYLPIFFPAGVAVFRMIRIVRIFRLFRINAYHDSLSVITAVIASKKQQLISSVFIILVLMVASSLCMYSLEHEAQPEVFTNAFSGIWWAASTLLTVGYGDIYPITMLGKLFGIFIAFLGVGMVAIPTGIISAGFVDQYSEIKKKMEYGHEADMQFIKIQVEDSDSWAGKRIAELKLPQDMIVAVVKRDEEILVPRGNMVVQPDDILVVGAEPFNTHEHIKLKEIVLKKQNPWAGMRICDLNISKHSIIVLVKRRNKATIPHGNMVLQVGDQIFLYTQLHLNEAMDIEV
ncbi:MAG: ion transporter [Lachnospiraceae bacterium]|nr:ion transporter [Lachnospiraceae bacterium]